MFLAAAATPEDQAEDPKRGGQDGGAEWLVTLNALLGRGQPLYLAIYIGLMVGQAVGRMKSSAADTVVACAGSVLTKQSTLSRRVEELVRTVGVRELHFIKDL